MSQESIEFAKSGPDNNPEPQAHSLRATSQLIAHSRTELGRVIARKRSSKKC
jgi:hypothetical protein